MEEVPEIHEEPGVGVEENAYPEQLVEEDQPLKAEPEQPEPEEPEPEEIEHSEVQHHDLPNGLVLARKKKAVCSRHS